MIHVYVCVARLHKVQVARLQPQDISLVCRKQNLQDCIHSRYDGGETKVWLTFPTER